MPLFATLLKGVLLWFVTQFGALISKRWAITLGVLAMFATITAAFVAAISGIGAGLAVAMPSWMGRAVCWFWPSNANACIAAVMAAHAVRWAYDVQKTRLDYAAWLGR